MNSYSIQRQNPITDDQLHSFLRDKQRWENAIVMYQGRDPLDHWYNYLLWYTAHGHGDPENKYRETLERCLTLFEHNEFYKHDERMVRLWLKYIDMQPNPLHFYQVLYQREVGRQVADFYISWAGYYESINALKDAEAVYDLSFQQKAQPYAALHHAHSKLMFARQQQQPQASAQPHQQALHQQQPPPQHHHHHPVPPQQHEATPPPPHQPPHQQQQPQHAKHISTSQQQVSYHAHAAVAYTAHEQHEDVYHQHHPHQHPHQQQHHHHHHQQQHPQQQQQLEPHQQQQHLHIQQQQQHLYHQPNAYESPQQHQQQQHAVHPVDPNASAAYSHGQHPAAPIPIEQHLPPANAVGRQHQQHFAEPPHHVQQHHADAQQLPPNGQLNHQPQPQPQPEPKAKHHHQPNHPHGTARLESAAATPPDDGRPSGVRLPRKFVPFSHNNTEEWRPPLYLEEPDDPSRQCHYAKNRVYPEGISGNEYSPEELRAACYRQRAKRNAVYQEQRQMEQESQPYKEPVHVTGPPPSEHYINGQYGAYANGIAHAVEAPESGVAPAEAEESQPACEEEAEEQEEEAENETEDGAEDDDEEEADAEEDEDDDEEEGVEDDADNEATLHRQQKQQQHQQSYHRQYHQDAHGNTYGSAHHQHIDSTVRFSMQTVQHDNQSKTIKIKFKKERHVDSDATNGGGAAGGGGYTIENFGQQEAQFSPIAREANSARRSEVHHSFQPYLLGQTSTPKSSGIGGKRHKSKLKRSSHHPYSSQKPQHNHHRDHHQQQHHNNNNNNNNNFQAAAFNNSNSSTAEFYGGDEVLKSNGGGGGASAATGMATAKSKKSSNSFREYNDNANYSFISAATLDNSNCSISSAVGRLNFRDITSAGGQHGLNNTTLGGAGGNSVADFSTFQENSYFATQHDYEAKERRLNKALETIERHMAKEAIDPFNSELCKAFLTKLDFPAAEDDDATANYKITQTPLPKIANTKALTLPDGVHFNIDKEVGRGSYGSVYKATDMTTGGIVALKYQKPPNIWEIYICYQVLKRIKNPNILPGYMDISTAIIAPNASLIATEFSPFGSLLDINNKIRQATTKVMHESLVMHFSSQICQIIQHLHRQHIIHADIKPDNFLLMRVPSTDLPYPSLRLIDFGCAIDMTLFPDRDDTKFRKVIQTDGFTCIEMQEGRPWSYETDLFCIAGTVHVMLLGEYMQLQKRCGAWDIKQKLPRYLKKHVWTKFFNEMLNINGGSLPDLGEMREVFDEETAKMDSELQKQIRSLSNILYKR